MTLMNVPMVLPVSFADYKPGFNQMNLHNTSERHRLQIKTVNELLMVSVNGPAQAAWNVSKYVISWLKAGRHKVFDKVTGFPKKANCFEEGRATRRLVII